MCIDPRCLSIDRMTYRRCSDLAQDGKPCQLNRDGRDKPGHDVWNLRHLSR